jgi:hypothetical protein
VLFIHRNTSDRLSALAGLDFSEMWAGSGSSDGSILALPSAVLGISEDEFYNNDGTGVDMRITADGHIRSIQASAG